MSVTSIEIVRSDHCRYVVEHRDRDNCVADTLADLGRWLLVLVLIICRGDAVAPFVARQLERA